MEPERDDPTRVPIGTAVALLRRDYPEISHSSLRFLEREGLIAPQRTQGGHRLYSTIDLERVRRIKAWQEQGLALHDVRDRLAQQEQLDPPGVLAERFLQLALDGDLPAARRLILGADDVGLPLQVLFLDVLCPALVTLGAGWQRGEIAVAQEKEISELARELIVELTLRGVGEREPAEAHLVAGCVAGELHELGLRMVCGLLRTRGLGVHFLGVDVAPDFLAEAIALRRPRAVLLSATRDDALPALPAALAAVRAAGSTAPVLAGGQAVARHPDRVAGWGAIPAPPGAAGVTHVLRRIDAVEIHDEPRD